MRLPDQNTEKWNWSCTKPSSQAHLQHQSHDYRQALPTICYSLTNSQIGVATHASNYLASTTSMRKKPSETTSKEPAWLLAENIRHSTRYHTPTCNTISNHSLSRLRRSGTSCQSTVIILHHLMSPNLLACCTDGPLDTLRRTVYGRPENKFLEPRFYLSELKTRSSTGMPTDMDRFWSSPGHSCFAVLY